MFVHTYMTSHTCTTGVYHQVLTRGWSAMQSSIFDYCTTPRRYTRICTTGSTDTVLRTTQRLERSPCINHIASIDAPKTCHRIPPVHRPKSIRFAARHVLGRHQGCRGGARVVARRNVVENVSIARPLIQSWVGKSNAWFARGNAFRVHQRYNSCHDWRRCRSAILHFWRPTNKDWV